MFELTRNEEGVTNISYYDKVNKRVQDFPNIHFYIDIYNKYTLLCINVVTGDIIECFEYY